MIACDYCQDSQVVVTLDADRTNFRFLASVVVDVGIYAFALKKLL
jgi:hypothetical protein